MVLDFSLLKILLIIVINSVCLTGDLVLCRRLTSISCSLKDPQVEKSLITSI